MPADEAAVEPTLAPGGSLSHDSLDSSDQAAGTPAAVTPVAAAVRTLLARAAGAEVTSEDVRSACEQAKVPVNQAKSVLRALVEQGVSVAVVGSGAASLSKPRKRAPAGCARRRPPG
jgi:hypothetical protein